MVENKNYVVNRLTEYAIKNGLVIYEAFNAITGRLDVALIDRLRNKHLELTFVFDNIADLPRIVDKSIFESDKCFHQLDYDKIAEFNAQMIHADLMAARRKPVNPKSLKIDRVIFNKPATIVFWKDGTKTIVKAQGKEKFDKEKGLAMAIAKKALGNEGKYYDEFKGWI